MTARSIAGAIAWCVAAGLWAPTSVALAATAKPSTTSSNKSSGKSATERPAATGSRSTRSTKPAGKVSTRSARPSSGRPAIARAAPVPLPTPGLSEAQLSAAGQVLTGRVECEFDQAVVVEPHAMLIGTFRVKHRSRTYQMVPVETSTGAVRLMDAKAGVVWLQIPVKSMMMDNRAGSRIVDACAHPTQRLAKAEQDAARAAAERAAAEAAALAATLPPGSPTLTQSVHPPDPRLPEPLLMAPTGAPPPPVPMPLANPAIPANPAEKADGAAAASSPGQPVLR